MREIDQVSIAEIAPDSITGDAIAAAAISALDSEFQAVATATAEIVLLPAIDSLDSDILDHIAYQLAVDFYDQSYTLTAKRNLVKQAIYFHRIKGTPGAVEKVLSDLGLLATITEWWELPDLMEPYTFSIDVQNTDEQPASPTVFNDIARAVTAAKNTRSHLTRIRANYDTNITGYAAVYTNYAAYYSVVPEDSAPSASCAYPLDDDGTLAAAFSAVNLALDAPLYNSGTYTYTGDGPDALAVPSAANVFTTQAIPFSAGKRIGVQIYVNSATAPDGWDAVCALVGHVNGTTPVGSLLAKLRRDITTGDVGIVTAASDIPVSAVDGKYAVGAVADYDEGTLYAVGPDGTVRVIAHFDSSAGGAVVLGLLASDDSEDADFPGVSETISVGIAPCAAASLFPMPAGVTDSAGNSWPTDPAVVYPVRLHVDTDSPAFEIATDGLTATLVFNEDVNIPGTWSMEAVGYGTATVTNYTNVSPGVYTLGVPAGIGVVPQWVTINLHLDTAQPMPIGQTTGSSIKLLSGAYYVEVPNNSEVV